ncbi:hypothetical protein FHS29_002735 [Saccharothrix tamanrassetensis]|uniref:DUF2332 domain-containing protein n=1 Tax=Saccharothrix tamanrassetensis TaxID=1051531 RepID=A0A841CFP5_9PSEU|nr:DUF2332 domain-containing protein [Saccharothrix tamanrassetensis]MBB5956149.1 hypothetical protein [Saccharothrix tamanrassetensis]
MLAELFLDAARGCRDHSPLTHTLLVSAADDLVRGGITTQVMAGAEYDRKGAVPGLRFAGALHRLVLEGRVPGLAKHYPTAGGRPDLDTLWDDALTVLHEHTDDLRALVDSTAVQTNEPGRNAPLFGGLQTATHLAAGMAGRRTAFPVRLLEVGASGGLNLRPHRIAYRSGDRVYGDRSSPFVLDTGWVGCPSVDLSHNLRLVRRAGCDLNPVDVSTEDGRLHLSSFIWADQTWRWERLQAALDLARLDPVPVQQATGPEWLADQLARPERDVLTVVWHSVVWQYVSPADRAMGRAILADAAARATPMAPLALLVFEPRRAHEDGRYRFQLLLKLWPSGISLRLGSGGGHGVPFTWDPQPWN